MALVEYALDENVAIVTMNDGENRFNPSFLDAFLSILDQIEGKTRADALVVVSSHEKIFSNGIDLDWLLPFVEQGDTAVLKSFLRQLMMLYRRILIYPMPTIAAVSGHAFAGGAILTCAFDFRFMRSDRGYLCFPEVDLGIPFLPGMIAVMEKAIPPYKLQEMQFTAKRLTAQECETHHIVQKACHMDELMGETVAFAKGLKKKRANIRALKEGYYSSILRIMEEEDPPVIESRSLFA